MEVQEKSGQPTLGTWDKLPTEETERKSKVTFDINIPVEVTFLNDQPTEFQGDNGAYYVFCVIQDGEEKIIMTSAWSLLRALKIHTPLKDKTLKICKRMVNGKQNFEVK